MKIVESKTYILPWILLDGIRVVAAFKYHIDAQNYLDGYKRVEIRWFDAQKA